MDDKAHSLSSINIHVLAFAHLIINATANNIKQFVRNSLLTSFVILEIELTQQLIGIISGRLHSHHTCRMFTSIAIK